MKTKNVAVLVFVLAVALSLGYLGTSQETSSADDSDTAVIDAENIAIAAEEGPEIAVSLEEEETEVSHVDEEEHAHEEVPAEYAGYSSNPYWDEKVSEYETAEAEGKEIYEANCMQCHGANGLGEAETYLPGVANFADREMTDEMTAEFWFWRISEGVPDTPMTMWKNTLTTDQIWKVMVYEHSFSHDGPHIHGDAEGDHVDENEH